MRSFGNTVAEMRDWIRAFARYALPAFAERRYGA
jgi:hypothetical protein